MIAARPTASMNERSGRSDGHEVLSSFGEVEECRLELADGREVELANRMKRRLCCCEVQALR